MSNRSNWSWEQLARCGDTKTHKDSHFFSLKIRHFLDGWISQKIFMLNYTAPKLNSFPSSGKMELEKLTTVGLSNFRPECLFFRGFFRLFPWETFRTFRMPTSAQRPPRFAAQGKLEFQARWSWEMPRWVVDVWWVLKTRDAPKINKNGGVIPRNAIWKWPDRKEWGGWCGTLR